MATGLPGLRGLGSSPRRSRRTTSLLNSVPPGYTEEETRSILRDVGISTLSGLNYIAGALDKAARPVRFGVHEGLERLGLAPQVDHSPSELLAWIPFSDTLGFTDRDNAVQGRDTVRFLTGEDPRDRSWLGFGAGLGYEIATDPFTYLSLGAGALTKSGKALKKAGLLDDVTEKAIAQSGNRATRSFTRRQLTGDAALDLLSPAQREGLDTGLREAVAGNQALQSNLGLFGRNIGTATAKPQGAERLLSNLRVGVRDSLPGRVFNKTFSTPAADALSRQGQEAGRQSAVRLREIREAAATPIIQARRATQELVESTGLSPRDFDDAIGAIAEGHTAADLDFLPENVLRRIGPENEEKLRGIVGGLVGSLDNYDTLYRRMDDLGLDAPLLADDFVSYSPRRLNRQKSGETRNFIQAAKDIFSTRSSSSRSRSIRNVPGGRTTMGLLMRDDELWRTLRSNPGLFEADDLVRPIAKSIKENRPLGAEAYKSLQTAFNKLGETGMAEQLKQGGVINGQLNRAAIEEATKAATKSLRDRLNPIYDEIGTRYLRMTGDETKKELSLRLKDLVQKIREATDETPAADLAKWKSDRNLIKRRLRKPKELARLIGRTLPDSSKGENLYLPFFDGLEQATAANARAVSAGEGVLDFLSQNATYKTPGVKDGFVPASKALKKAGFKRLDKALPQLARRYAELTGQSQDDILLRLQQGQIGIDEPLARDMASMMRVAQGTKGQGFLGEFVDSIHRFVKPALTSVHPAFSTRNRVSGAVLNVLSDAYDPRFTNPLTQWLQPNIDAASMRLGNAVKGAGKIKGLSPDDAIATRELSEEILQHGLDPGLGREFGGEADVFASPQFGAGRKPEKLSSAVAGLGKGYFELAAETVKGRPSQGVAKLADRGRHLTGVIEWDNRVAPYIAFRRQGYSPSAAADRVKLFHADYHPSAFTATENTYLRRVFPFYSFQRQVAAQLASELYERPGGKLAWMFRAEDKASSEDILPDNLKGSISLGGTATDAAYLSSLGMPTEILADLIRPESTGAGTLASTFGGIASHLSPLFRVPLENLVVGKNLYTGQDISDSPTNAHRILQGLLKLERPPDYGPGATTAIRAAEGAADIFGLGRGLSSVRTLVDQRKDAGSRALNLLTGARISHINRDETRDREIKRLLSNSLSALPGAYNLSRPVISADALQGLSPEQQRAWLLLRQL